MYAAFHRFSFGIVGPGEGRTEGCYMGGAVGASARLEEHMLWLCEKGVHRGACDVCKVLTPEIDFFATNGNPRTSSHV